LIQFGLDENMFTGTLPKEWSAMTTLVDIRGTFNQITGTVPAEWTAMRSLKRVELGYLRLTGTLPTQWSALEQLDYLDLSGNALSSPLPPEFSVLTNLKHLDLSVNRLVGTLPPQWSTHKQLEILDIGMNFLEGGIPLEWHNMGQLHALLLSSNELDGTLPGWTAPLGFLSAVELHHNRISGSLPKSWSKWASLYYLDASYNRINGSLPREWSTLQNLTTLVLENNFLTGTLPHQWSSWWQLERIVLKFNSLSGHLPVTWNAWQQVEEISVAQNVLDLHLPMEWSSMVTLTKLSVADNFLTGSLPVGWSTWARMAVIRVQGNFLTGTLPHTWSAMEDLSEMSLGGNLLTGTLPQEWSNLPGLRVVAAQDNFLRGSLPKEYSMLDSLVYIDMGSNRITGTIPRQWSSMSLLQVFNMENNGLFGTIPPEMAGIQELITVHLERNYLRGRLGLIAHKRISTLHLHENFFSGTLPLSWSSLERIVDLRLHSNELSGTIHPEWSTMTSIQSLYLGTNRLIGSLPETFSALTNLEFLDSWQNRHTGTLPRAWSALSNLGNLVLGSNMLRGTLPTEYSAWHEDGKIVESLSFDDNLLTGTLPLSWSVLEPRFLYVHGNQLECPTDGVLPYSLEWPIENSIERSDVDLSTWQDVLCPEVQPRSGLPQAAVLGLSVVSGAVLGLLVVLALFVLIHRLTCRDPTCAHRHPGLKHSLAGHFLPGLTVSSCRWCLCNTGKPDMNVMFKKEVKPLLKSSSVIGVGGYGQVYRASWRGHDVAIKVILNGVDDVAINSFRTEVEASSRFTGDSKFVRLLGACMTKPDLCLISEFVPGGSLQSMIDGNPSGLPMAKVLTYGMDLAEALSHMHPEYVHRDLKPDNILLSPDSGSVKLIDFGMGRIVDNPLIDKTMTQGAGTPAYMAPEQFEGHITPKTDIYALGIILCQCLSGKAPFSRLNNQQIMYAVLIKEERPEIPENCPELLRLLLARCWEENPKLRPAADEVRHMLGFLHASLDSEGSDTGDSYLDSYSDSPRHFAQQVGHMLSRRDGGEEAVQAVEGSAMSHITEVSEDSYLTSAPPLSNLGSRLMKASSRVVGDGHGVALAGVGSRGGVRGGQISLAGQLGAILSRDRVCVAGGSGCDGGGCGGGWRGVEGHGLELHAMDSRASAAEDLSFAQQLGAVLSRDRAEREQGQDRDHHHHNAYSHARHPGLSAMASVVEEPETSNSTQLGTPSVPAANTDEDVQIIINQV